MEIKEDKPFPLLKYRLIGATSEDPENSFYNLISSLNNNGWSSARYCTYPQELLIQMSRPCRLRQIDLLFHEYKISSKIEVYYFFPNNYNDFNLDIEDLVFKKIGDILPSNNNHTKYQYREFKKVFLDENVYYLKFIFHQNYQNLKNIFNQVGIINIQCFGIDFTPTNINNLYPKNKKQNIPENKTKEQSDDNIIDQICKTKMHELKEALNLCIKIENYDQAKKIYEMIELVRKISEKINDAVEIRDKALKMDDFDTCKVAQNNIEFLREQVKNIDIGYLGLGKEKEEEKVEPKVEPIPEREPKQQNLAVKSSELGDEDESVRETVKYNI